MTGPDVLVVGSGVAGLAAALRLAPRRVRLLTASPVLASGSSPLAQGGIAAAVGEGDSAEAHAQDTAAAGAGLGDAEAVASLTGAGSEAIAWLRSCGVRFDPGLAREGAHGAARVLHAGGDAIGAELVRALGAAVECADHVEVVTGTRVLALLRHGVRVVGAGTAGGDHVAGAVVLATGGVGGLYAATTNPPTAVGEGILLAGDVGARLADLEFVQFHPTALAVGRDPMPLLTEALRGEGALLLDAAGRRFVDELAPRDVVAVEVERAWQATGGAFLDARAIGSVARRFPSVARLCHEAGLDPATDLLPVRPAAHYHMGGIAVDGWGRSSVPGLWACGEVAATGAHGANRLASNSLLEAVVLAARLGEALRGRPLPRPAPRHAEVPRQVSVDRDDLRAAMRACMIRDVGLLRSGPGLAAARETLSTLGEEAAAAGDRRTARACRLARWITVAAEARRESRGAHRRSDWPATDPAQARRRFWTAAALEGGFAATRRTAGAAPGV
ncbi:MAG TPA: FAD-binding protein [Candidatus Polarisedimenticolaceae bacterium]|nr:FAD-binding protein [Candidatus Polarisedimenticolaceae bacterium]